MTLNPLDLLRVLGSGVRPDASAPAARPEGPESFREMLEKARAGEFETGLPVSVASGAGIDLSQETLDRLATIVDRAHAEGATRIVVLHEGKALDVDVLGRQVLGLADLSRERVATGIDGVVRLAAEPPLPPLPMPGGAMPAGINPEPDETEPNHAAA